ncbi:MAG: NAD(P)H-quinone oxidoreductase [Herpetosiphonaceae bacterium]|nr:NAD(P)H-quinone oxidoreductase [Herpetosiphonaceae bacterium]
MRAVMISEPGGPDVLKIGEIPQPIPQADQVLVRVDAAGLNRADLLQRKGGYPAPAGIRADIPGLEFAGIVADVGSAVDQWKVDDRVFGIVGGAGQAEYVVTAADQIAAIPSNLDPIAAAAVPEVFMTAYDALQQGGLAADKRVLVHAVGSGVGTAALQLAKAAGAMVYGTARTAAKLKQATELGLEQGFVQDGDSWVSELMAATGGQGVDLVLDFVGAPLLQANLDVLASRGRIIVIGTMGGARGELNLGLLMRKRACIIGTMLRIRPPAEKARLTGDFARDVVPLLASGEVKPIIDRVFLFDQIAGAHRYMESNANFGKIVLAVGVPVSH